MKNISKKIRNIILGILVIFLSQLAVPIPFGIKINPNFWWIVAAIILFFSLTDLREKKLAKNAFLMIFILGTAVAIVKPVQYGLDEESHLQNAIGISDSLVFKYSAETLTDYDSVFAHDGIRNQSNYKDDDYWFNVKHKSSIVKGTMIGFDNPAFLPGMFGWNLGRLISDKVYISYYLGRIFHVLAYAFLVYFAIKSSKSYKEIIYFLGTIPSVLYIITAFHYDYLYYGSSLLLVAFITNVFSGYSKVTKKSAIIYQIISLMFIFSKFPLVLAGSFLSFLPNKYYDKKQTRWFSTILFSASMVIALVYAGMINVFPILENASANPRPSIFYFIRHPLPIIRTMLDAPGVILDNFISHPLQYISHQSSLLVTLNAVVFIVFMVLLSIKSNIKVNKLFSKSFVVVSLAIIALIIYSISGDPRVYHPGNLLIGGVQGRYYYLFITFIPLFLGNILTKLFPNLVLEKEYEERIQVILQYTIVFLNIFTIGIAYYTQI